MQHSVFLLSLVVATTVSAAAHLSTKNGACTDLQIPVTISEKRYVVDAVVEDNWDAVSLTFNLSSRDFGTASDPIPVFEGDDSLVTSNYFIGATLCGTGSTVLVLTHGIIESKLYFQPTFSDSDQYSFVDAAVAAGYSVLNYDRIGVGSSSKVDGHQDAQFHVEVAVLNALIAHARTLTTASKVALVGHSYGAYLSAASAAALGPAVDALVLTGFSGSLAYFPAFAAGASFRVARLQDPRRWGALPPSYLASADVYAETYAYFATPYFEHRVAEWAFEVASEPFAAAELLTLAAAKVAYGDVTAPTLVLQGRYDVSACGGDCVGLLGTLRDNFTEAAVLQTVDDLPAGHSLFLHGVAPQAFQMVFNFLKENSL